MLILKLIIEMEQSTGSRYSIWNHRHHPNNKGGTTTPSKYVLLNSGMVGEEVAAMLSCMTYISTLYNTSFVAEGPGAGINYGSYGTGATHGGSGGCQNADQPAPPTYGSFTNPSEYGSGGGLNGGPGGGIVSMDVSLLRVEGSVGANGGDSVGSNGGGGSGGSVVIKTITLEGSGLIQVRCMYLFCL